MAKMKKLKLSFRTVLTLFTFVLVGYVIYQNWADIVETMEHLGDTNVFVLLLLIPEQLFMYYACGQIFFSYLKKQRNISKISNKEVLGISTELNFVNHAVPAGGIGGLAFLTYRLKPMNVTAGQASFLYLFRYAVTTVVNYLQALVAIIILIAAGLMPESAMWIVPVTFLMNTAVAGVLWFIVFVASSRRRIDFFAKIVEKTTSFVARSLTFGRKKYFVKGVKIQAYFSDIHESLKIVKRDKQNLKRPFGWGLVYSLCEVGTYYIVALSLGRPELLLYIMVGEAIGSVFDGIVPYGLYELGMAGVMIALGVDFPTATIITVMTRVITLIFTVVSGVVPYYKAMKGKQNE